MRQDDFRAALEAGDVRLCRRMWSAFMPPQPEPEHAETAMHMARTAAETVSFKARAWSHRWLTERGSPSQLPDRLKPSAERLYPRIAEGVGISVDLHKPGMLEVRTAMEAVVADSYANGDTDPAVVRSRMAEVRKRTIRQLFGAA
jgi:hypothetical protein